MGRSSLAFILNSLYNKEMITLAMIFASVTQILALPPGLLSAVCYVESAHRVSAYQPHDGKGPSIGVCQIKPSTARQLGFNGKASDLFDPKTNIFYAGKYLHYQIKRYNGNLVEAVAGFNAGRYIRNNKNQPINNHYVEKVFSAWGQKK